MQNGRIVYGIEGDMAWTNASGNVTVATTTGCAGTCSTDMDWFGTVRGRLGVTWGNMLPYVTGGLAVAKVNAGDTGGPVSASNTRAGWTVGGGLETSLTSHWSAKIEYLYVDLGSPAVNYGTLPAWSPTDASLRANVVRAGLDYKLF